MLLCHCKLYQVASLIRKAKITLFILPVLPLDSGLAEHFIELKNAASESMFTLCFTQTQIQVSLDSDVPI